METWQIVLIGLGLLFLAVILIIILSCVVDKTGLTFRKIKNEDLDKYYNRDELLKNHNITKPNKK
jgi:hypothetical protein